MAVSSMIVGISDCKVTRDADSVLVTYALGSCIAVAMHDPVTKVSGLLHYMLPESAIDAKKAEQNPFMFADTGIPRLIEAVKAAGGDGKRMMVQAGRRGAGAGQPGRVSNRQAQLPGGAADFVEGGDSDRRPKRWAARCRGPLAWRSERAVSGFARGAELSGSWRGIMRPRDTVSTSEETAIEEKQHA